MSEHIQIRYQPPQTRDARIFLFASWPIQVEIAVLELASVAPSHSSSYLVMCSLAFWTCAVVIHDTCACPVGGRWRRERVDTPTSLYRCDVCPHTAPVVSIFVFCVHYLLAGLFVPWARIWVRSHYSVLYTKCRKQYIVNGKHSFLVCTVSAGINIRTGPAPKATVKAQLFPKMLNSKYSTVSSRSRSV